MSNAKRRTDTRRPGYARTFDSTAAYEQWLETNTDEPTLNDETPEERFRQLGDLSDSAATLNPSPREHFTAAFDSFKAYEAWKNDG